MFDLGAAPFYVGPIKIWPAHSRPGYKWFAAVDGKPYYFRTANEARLFANDYLSIEDKDQLCD